MKKTRPFTIEAYKAMTESEHVETRGGSPVRIICTDLKIKDFPVVGLVNDNNSEMLFTYSADGRVASPVICKSDLFIVRETTTRTGWVNLFKGVKSGITTGDVYDTKEEALEENAAVWEKVSTVQISWEE